MKTELRFATAADIEQLIALRFDYFSAENMVMTDAQHTQIEQNLRGYFSRHLGTSFFAAVVEVDGKPASVAFLSVFEKPANPSFPTGKTATVYNVFTYPGNRKKGYATQAMNALVEKGREHGLSYIDLSATGMGKPLYEKLGFEQKAGSHYTEMRLRLETP